MDRVTLHKIWAPDASVWSPWVKPVPFAFWPRALKSETTALREEVTPALFPAIAARCALVIDFPGGESVRCGELLATLGYRPVPVFSSCPLPANQQGLHRCAVDAESIITALAEVAPTLSQLAVPDNAPPAFLIDALRRAPGVFIPDDYFDNRSAIFPSDFPSGETLKQHGIERILIIRDRSIPPSSDLGHALNHWRQSGLRIDAINHEGTALGVDWPATGFFGTLVQRVKLLLSLRPNSAGGYGRFIPESSGG